jgi:8-oxo-dGTP pyrophosphatase MutT (NUDIX family)
VFGIESITAALLPVEQALAIDAAGRASAVLIPVRPRADGTTSLVFTKRPDHMPRHAGEISFPGGRPEPEDDGLLATALREADEELGIEPANVRVLGGLPPISTYVTDFAVHPVVGVVPSEMDLKPHPGEVEAVLEYRLTELARSHATQEWERGEHRFTTDIFDMDGNVIWGATARIIGMLLERIDAARRGAVQR